MTDFILTFGASGDESTGLVSDYAVGKCPLLSNLPTGSAIDAPSKAGDAIIAYLDDHTEFLTLIRNPQNLLRLSEAWILAQQMGLPAVQNRLIDRFSMKHRYDLLNLRDNGVFVPMDCQVFEYIREKFGTQQTKIEDFCVTYLANVGDRSGFDGLPIEIQKRIKHSAEDMARRGNVDIIDFPELYRVRGGSFKSQPKPKSLKIRMPMTTEDGDGKEEDVFISVKEGKIKYPKHPEVEAAIKANSWAGKVVHASTCDQPVRPRPNPKVGRARPRGVHFGSVEYRSIPHRLDASESAMPSNAKPNFSRKQPWVDQFQAMWDSEMQTASASRGSRSPGLAKNREIEVEARSPRLAEKHEVKVEPRRSPRLAKNRTAKVEPRRSPRLAKNRTAEVEARSPSLAKSCKAKVEPRSPRRAKDCEVEAEALSSRLTEDHEVEVEVKVLAQQFDLLHVQNRLVMRFQQVYKEQKRQRTTKNIDAEAFEYISLKLDHAGTSKIEKFLMAYYAGLAKSSEHVKMQARGLKVRVRSRILGLGREINVYDHDWILHAIDGFKVGDGYELIPMPAADLTIKIPHKPIPVIYKVEEVGTGIDSRATKSSCSQSFNPASRTGISSRMACAPKTQKLLMPPSSSTEQSCRARTPT
ncbi:hypothetical protein EJ04DRAFT_570228 [Polyplosphaeria fusca]|uniref:Uncharacterized protein n=1 Tax=Polyplosphaeria fusca TaxID=682080 RepID=A0A9P4UWX3_9PLEO|nr:hypothetical protein EJ04DRAFT_570228 [Polyplosphaeria fusca]